MALGLLPSEVEDIGASDYDLLWRHWLEEPWGPFRDNMHAAMIAREVRKTAFKGDHKLDQWMITKPKVSVGKEFRNAFFNLFKIGARRRTKKQQEDKAKRKRKR